MIFNKPNEIFSLSCESSKVAFEILKMEGYRSDKNFNEYDESNKNSGRLEDEHFCTFKDKVQISY